MMIKNQKGTTLAEVLVAMAITSLAIYIIASYLSGLNQLHNQLKLRRVAGNAIQSLAESIRFDTSLYQVSFDNSSAAEDEKLDPETLPFAISNDSIVARADCKAKALSCRAYMGYVIFPSAFVRNLYEVKFLVVAAGDKSVKWEQTYFITVK